MLVVDASVLAPAVADDGADGAEIRGRLRHEVIAAPDLLRVEVTSVIRRHRAAGRLSSAHANAALDDLLDFPVRVFPTAPLLRRVWELRDNVSVYDACYVALAEALDVPLLTADVRLINVPGTHCAIEQIP